MESPSKEKKKGEGVSTTPSATPLGSLPSPWPCGSLETGSISVGFTCCVSTCLLFLWFVQTLLEVKHAFISVVITCLVVFVLMVSNCSGPK